MSGFSPSLKSKNTNLSPHKQSSTPGPPDLGLEALRKIPGFRLVDVVVVGDVFVVTVAAVFLWLALPLLFIIVQ